MTTFTKALAAALLLGALLAPAPAAAQTAERPVVVKQKQKPKNKPGEQKLEVFKGEVLHLTRHAMTVRSQENANLVRTFNYDEKVALEVGKMLDAERPFQYGDRVELGFRPGTEVVVEIKGKPSKPLPPITGRR